LDPKQLSKIIETLFTLTSIMEAQELIDEVKLHFNPAFVSKLEERVGL
jgi:hypothetical protein